MSLLWNRPVSPSGEPLVPPHTHSLATTPLGASSLTGQVTAVARGSSKELRALSPPAACLAPLSTVKPAQQGLFQAEIHRVLC